MNELKIKELRRQLPQRLLKPINQQYRSQLQLPPQIPKPQIKMVSPLAKTFKAQQQEILPAIKTPALNSGKKRDEADEERSSEKEGVGELEDSFKQKIEAEQQDDMMYGEDSHQFSDEM